MSEQWNASLHPENTAGGRKLARLRAAADSSMHGSPAIIEYGNAAREAYLDPEKFANEAEQTDPPPPVEEVEEVEKAEEAEWADEEAEEEEEEAREAAAAKSKGKGHK